MSERSFENLPFTLTNDNLKLISEELMKYISGRLQFLETKVTIDLNEYVTLKILEKDFSSILSIVGEGLELNYDKDGLRYNGDYNALANAIKILYPDIYSSVFAELKEEDK